MHHVIQHMETGRLWSSEVGWLPPGREGHELFSERAKRVAKLPPGGIWRTVGELAADAAAVGMAEITAGELFERWPIHPAAVIETLANDHPGLTALFLVQGCHDKRLTVSDCNAVANLLIERRRRLICGESTKP